ncbi:MAG: GIY-YIG nuclease family protein [Cyanobium sp. M30B3]|nr:MAG: GIY-YIG nuclease family protein [Cyanobium sp. M30B3]
MTTTPKTIQIFLPSGEPHGIRIAEITTRIVQVIEVPRSLLSSFLSMEQSSQVGVYFLIGEHTVDGDRLVYVGQTGDLRARLTAHNQKKDFWDRVLVLVSRTNSLTQTHALFLEWHALKQIRDAGRFADDNGNAGSRPHTPAPLEAECLEIFETGHTLISSLGFPLFDRVVSASSPPPDSDTLYCCSPGTGVDARGLYTAEGFVVLEGSIAREAMTPSTTPAQRQWRQRLVDRGVMQPDGNGGLMFTRDHLFQTPSGAAIAVMARRANGWTEWKNAAGLTLHQLQREPQGAAPGSA